VRRFGSIAAVVVTYRPEDELIRSLRYLNLSCDRIFIVDNSWPGENKVIDQIRQFDRVELTLNDKNLGIASALNVGVQQALAYGVDWIVTLDQDSCLDEEWFLAMGKAYEAVPDKTNLGLLAPVHFDSNSGYVSRKLSKMDRIIERQTVVMTSGNLVPRATFEKVGGFDERLFIEYVDHDFCLKVKKRGLQTYIVPGAKMAHRLGDMRKHGIGGFFFFSHNYLPVRRYYRARNRLILYKRHIGLWILQDQDFAIRDMIKILLVEKDRWKKVQATLEGSLHALLRLGGSYEDSKQQQKAQLATGYLNKNEAIPNIEIRQVLKNSGYNFLGHILPLVVGLLCIRLLMDNIGIERFGILTIVWAMIGYFSLFDFGLSRIITVKVSELLSKNKIEEVNVTFWTSLKIMFFATLIGSGILMAMSFFDKLLLSQVSADVLDESVTALRLIALALPAITLTAGVKGALEADSQFFKLNVIQSFLGVFNFLIPTLISIVHGELGYIVLSLLVIRYSFLGVHFWALVKTSSWLRSYQVQKISESFSLIVSGGWVSVSNIVSPVMTYFDRFFLAFLIPASQLAFYTTPFEIVNRLLIVPSSITRALFPVIAAQTGEERNRYYFGLSFNLVLVVSVFVMLIGLAAGYWGLGIWLGDEFAEKSYSILAVLLVGFLINAMAWTPFSYIQAVQRPDLTAKAHLIELPLYCFSLYFFTVQWGLIGAAVAWALRNFIDFMILYTMARRLLSKQTEPVKFSTQST
jgi:O-antigen/teichoic acid export membrane protein/GT2 family glycosyltransferase